MVLGENIMLRRGKRWLAIGLAVTVGCMIPMGTMKASEEGESVSQNSISVEEQYEQPAEIPAQNETATVTIKITLENDSDVARPIDTPVALDVKAYNNHGQAFVVTAEGSTSLTYYLDTDSTTNTRSKEQLNSLCKQSVPSDGRIPLSNDGKYVLYVKAAAEGTAVYAVSKYRIVVDTQKPLIKGIKGGEKYPVGQTFTVEEENLLKVTINEKPVSPDGEKKYTIEEQPNVGNTYVIKAEDIAGWSDTVTVTLTDTTPEPEEPASNTITKPGTYSLQSGTEYKLGAGSWKVAGDSSVYPGGITFYASGTYTFQK